MSIRKPKVNGCTHELMKKLTLAMLLLGAICLPQTYTVGPDSQRQPGVPQVR
jgi:hypothetical protein